MKPTRVLFAGDTHGDPKATLALIEAGADIGADCVFVLGDFGMWEHMDQGVRFLDVTSEAAHKAGVPVRFIDGNHDNHPMLWSMYGDGCAHPEKVRPSIYYHGRGLRWEWGGLGFMSLGGGVSIDKEYRKIWESWWPTEIIEDTDVTYAIRGGKLKVDVLLSHDAPPGLDHVFHLDNAGFKMSHTDSSINRNKLNTVINIVEPRYVFHGHMHVNHRTDLTYQHGVVKVLGLENTDTHGAENPLRGARVVEFADGEVLL